MKRFFLINLVTNEDVTVKARFDWQALLTAKKLAEGQPHRIMAFETISEETEEETEKKMENTYVRTPKAIEMMQRMYWRAVERHNEIAMDIPDDVPFEEYEKKIFNSLERVKYIDRKIRASKEPNWRPLPTGIGQKISVADFLVFTGSAFFNDWDGYGYYIEGDQMSDIMVYPTDVDFDIIREDFSGILWFNK